MCAVCVCVYRVHASEDSFGSQFSTSTLLRDGFSSFCCCTTYWSLVGTQAPGQFSGLSFSNHHRSACCCTWRFYVRSGDINSGHQGCVCSKCFYPLNPLLHPKSIIFSTGDRCMNKQTKSTRVKVAIWYDRRMWRKRNRKISDMSYGRCPWLPARAWR